VSAPITLDAQIADVEREISMRKAVYPKWIAAGKLKQAKADAQIASMEAVSVTLNWLRRNEETIRRAVNAAKGV
jgi:hypothetical protein